MHASRLTNEWIRKNVAPPETPVPGEPNEGYRTFALAKISDRLTSITTLPESGELLETVGFVDQFICRACAIENQFVDPRTSATRRGYKNMRRIRGKPVRCWSLHMDWMTLKTKPTRVRDRPTREPFPESRDSNLRILNRINSALQHSADLSASASRTAHLSPPMVS